MAKTEGKEKRITLAEYFANATANKSTSDSLNVIRGNLNNKNFIDLVKNPEVEYIAKKKGIVTPTPKVKYGKETVTRSPNLIELNMNQPGFTNAIDILSALQHELTHAATAAVQNGKISEDSRVKDEYAEYFVQPEFKTPIKNRRDIASILGINIANKITNAFKANGKSPEILLRDATFNDYYPTLFSPIETLAYGAAPLRKFGNDIDKYTDQYRILENMRNIYRNNLLWYFKNTLGNTVVSDK